MTWVHVALIFVALAGIGSAIGGQLACSNLRQKLEDTRVRLRNESREFSKLERKYSKLAKEYEALASGFEKKLEPEVAAAVDDLEDWIEELAPDQQGQGAPHRS